MTTYRDRHLAGQYVGTVKTTKADAEPEAEPAAEPSPAKLTTKAPNLDELTKAELLEFAQQLGVSPANNAMTKDELRAGVDEKLA